MKGVFARKIVTEHDLARANNKRPGHIEPSD